MRNKIVSPDGPASLTGEVFPGPGLDAASLSNTKISSLRALADRLGHFPSDTELHEAADRGETLDHYAFLPRWKWRVLIHPDGATVMNALTEWRRAHPGEVLTYGVIERDKDLPEPGKVIEVLGSVPRARNALDEKRYSSEEEKDADILDLSVRLGHTPSKREAAAAFRRGECIGPGAMKPFEKRKARLGLALSPKRKPKVRGPMAAPEEVLSALQDIKSTYQKKGRATISDLKQEFGEKRAGEIIKAVGSLPAGRKEAGVVPRKVAAPDGSVLPEKEKEVLDDIRGLAELLGKEVYDVIQDDVDRHSALGEILSGSAIMRVFGTFTRAVSLAAGLVDPGLRARKIQRWKHRPPPSRTGKMKEKRRKKVRLRKVRKNPPAKKAPGRKTPAPRATAENAEVHKAHRETTEPAATPEPKPSTKERKPALRRHAISEAGRENREKENQERVDAMLRALDEPGAEQSLVRVTLPSVQNIPPAKKAPGRKASEPGAMAENAEMLDAHCVTTEPAAAPEPKPSTKERKLETPTPEPETPQQPAEELILKPAEGNEAEIVDEKQEPADEARGRGNAEEWEPALRRHAKSEAGREKREKENQERLDAMLRALDKPGAERWLLRVQESLDEFMKESHINAIIETEKCPAVAAVFAECGHSVERFHRRLRTRLLCDYIRQFDKNSRMPLDIPEDPLMPTVKSYETYFPTNTAAAPDLFERMRPHLKSFSLYLLARIPNLEGMSNEDLFAFVEARHSAGHLPNPRLYTQLFGRFRLEEELKNYHKRLKARERKKGRDTGTK